MVMTGHHNKRQKSIPLVGEMKKGVFDNLCKSVVSQVGDGRFTIKDRINQFESKFLLDGFPLGLIVFFRPGTFCKFVSVTANSFEPFGADTSLQTGCDKEWFPGDVDVRQISPTNNPVFTHGIAPFNVFRKVEVKVKVKVE